MKATYLLVLNAALRPTQFASMLGIKVKLVGSIKLILPPVLPTINRFNWKFNQSKH